VGSGVYVQRKKTEEKLTFPTVHHTQTRVPQKVTSPKKQKSRETKEDKNDKTYATQGSTTKPRGKNQQRSKKHKKKIHLKGVVIENKKEKSITKKKHTHKGPGENPRPRNRKTYLRDAEKQRTPLAGVKNKTQSPKKGRNPEQRSRQKTSAQSG